MDHQLSLRAPPRVTHGLDSRRMGRRAMSRWNSTACTDGSPAPALQQLAPVVEEAQLPESGSIEGSQLVADLGLIREPFEMTIS